jgi:recombinase-like zinc beta ribbon protein
MATAEWLVLLPNRCPAYISPEQYERNQVRLQANRARADAMGAVRVGTAHFSGLVVCARCGCRLTVHYDGGGPLHTYECVERWTRLRGTQVPASGGLVPRCLCEPTGPRRAFCQPP